MRTLDVARTAFVTIRNRMRGIRWGSEFTCGDCEQNDRCSLPPSDSCAVRAEQIARGKWKFRKHDKRLAAIFGLRRL